MLANSPFVSAAHLGRFDARTLTSHFKENEEGLSNPASKNAVPLCNKSYVNLTGVKIRKYAK